MLLNLAQMTKHCLWEFIICDSPLVLICLVKLIVFVKLVISTGTKICLYNGLQDTLSIALILYPNVNKFIQERQTIHISYII